MSRAEGTDPQLDYFETKGTPARYLMTSPEFHLKRLLSAGFGDVFEIAKAFRVDEIGARHNSEFSLVEWYRVGMPMETLMTEVEDLCTQILGREVKAKRTRWKDAFLNYAGIDPFEKPGEAWRKVLRSARRSDVQCSEKFSQEDWWDYLMVTVVEPHLCSSGPEFLMDYPVSQAALAQTFTRTTVAYGPGGLNFILKRWNSATAIRNSRMPRNRNVASARTLNSARRWGSLSLRRTSASGSAPRRNARGFGRRARA